MTRVSLLLIIATLGSAMYLVSVQYESRRLFTELERAQRAGRRLKTEIARLEEEKRSQATPARVERVAREKLQMHQVTPGITLYMGQAQSPEQHP